jgi:hypothetical protein
MIATILTDMFNQPGYVAKPMTCAESVTAFDEHLGKLHSESKRVFSRVINDAMCLRIGIVS